MSRKILTDGKDFERVVAQVNETNQKTMNTETIETRASIFTAEQEATLRQLKAWKPFRVVWGCIDVNTQEFSSHCDIDRRKLNAQLRKGNLVATIG